MNIPVSFFKKWLMVTSLMLQSAWVFAHPPGLSSLDVSVGARGVDVGVTFALQDIEAFAPMDSDLDAEVSDAERDAAKPGIAKLLAQQLRIDVDGVDYSPAEPGEVSFDDQNNAHVRFRYLLEPKGEMLVQSKFLAMLPDGHQQYLTFKDATGRTVDEKMLGKGDDQIRISFPGFAEGERSAGASSWVAGFVGFFKLGIEHILTGYDHLLFLFALLAVTHSFWPALRIITFFTLAHSITLASAGLGIIELPSSFVEPFIAVTIIYVSVENIVRSGEPKGRHWLTFAFGLIHGFGFAGVLREMDISSGDTGILLPLLSFNLGIETGQIAVASIVLPLIWWLNSHASIAERSLRGCSIMVCLMGSYWLLERTVL